MRVWRYWFLLVAPAVFGQTSINVVPGTALAGSSGTASMTISSTSAGAEPSALQWTLTYSSSVFSNVKLTSGTTLNSAAKSLSCVSSTGQLRCMVWGYNNTAIRNGVLASVSFTVAANAPASSPLGLKGLIAVSPAAKTLATTATGATQTIKSGTPQPKLSKFTCEATSILSLGKTVCTVTLTSPVTRATSIVVQIGVNSDHATVPASITIPVGWSSGTFTVSVGTVAAVATVPVVVGLDGVSLKVYLSLLP